MKSNMFLKVFLLFAAVLWLSGCDQTRLRNKGNKLFGNSYTSTTDIESKQIPSGYVEVATDTILTTNFVVSSLYHSTNDKILKLEKTGRGVLNKTDYKQFHSDVSICYDEKLIFKKRIERDTFINDKDEFLKNAQMQSFQLNEIASVNDRVVFSVVFYNPTKETFFDYELIVDKSGDYYIERV